MTIQKRRTMKNIQPNPETIDLGVIELNATQSEMLEQFSEIGTTDLDTSNTDTTQLTVPTSVSQPIVFDSSVQTSRVSVGIYKLSGTAKTPKYATSGSACFDLYSDFSDVKTVKVYTSFNIELNRPVQKFLEFDNSPGIVVDAGERALIPTNLIFDIPEGWKMLIYARSGIAFKRAMLLANSVGVVDHDYVDPTFVIIFNQSKERQVIKQGDRIAQAELVPVTQASFNFLSEAPVLKTMREGGFGSTGE